MCPREFTETQSVSTLNEVDVGRLANEMWRSYSVGSTTYYFMA